MKTSRYNHFFPIEDEKTLGINCLSGCMVIFTPSLMHQYKALVKDLDLLGDEKNSLIDELKKGMFILDKNFDELSYLKVLYRKKQFDNSTLALTVLPTLNCNF